MMRSLFSGVSGLKSHQTRMDVIGNNISNINTIGFKASRTTFSDMLSQLQRNASSPTDNLGGINPRQIGLGAAVESIDLLFTDASPQQTGKNTDLALSGNGLFVLKNGDQSYYTRNGAFEFDADGYYVLPGSGLRVQGWNASDEGILNTNGLATDVIVPVGKTMAARETTEINYTGNLNAQSLTITKISYTTALGGDASRVTTNFYSTAITLNAQFGGTVSANVNPVIGSTKYTSGDATVPLSVSYTIDTSGTSPRYNITYRDEQGNVVATEANATNKPTVSQVLVTASADSTESTNTRSVNVDTENVLSATLTLSDGTTQTVTSGYYEVGRSIPVTTLATIYDSEGGKHQVTLLIDKDPSSGDSENNAAALSTATLRASNGTVVKGAENIQRLANNAGYTYTASEITILDGTNGEPIQATNIKPTYAADGTTITGYTYVDADGVQQTIAQADIATLVKQIGDTVTLKAGSKEIYDNRWRMYIVPEPGTQGPAGENFSNIYVRSAATGNPEEDGSSTTGIMNNGNISYIYFDERGQYVTHGQGTDPSIVFSYGDGNGASSNQAVISLEGLTQYANNTTSFPTTNGYTSGVLQSVAIDGSGIITGTYTNGLTRAEAQIAVAQFSNNSGLTKIGTTIYQESNNSGEANVKTIADFGLTVISSALEMSNVDLASEFSDMIITQRGFQANSKMTTVADEMLETVVNMKR